MKITSKDHQELLKAAAEVTQRLEQSTVRMKKIAKENSDLRKVAMDQEKLIEAQTFAIEMAKEGSIDISQVPETVARVLKFGVEIYKEAMDLATGSAGVSFGEVTEEKTIEKSASGPTYKGEPVNPVEAVLLGIRETLYGIPSPLDQ